MCIRVRGRVRRRVAEGVGVARRGPALTSGCARSLSGACGRACARPCAPSGRASRGPAPWVQGLGRRRGELQLSEGRAVPCEAWSAAAWCNRRRHVRAKGQGAGCCLSPDATTAVPPCQPAAGPTLPQHLGHDVDHAGGREATGAGARVGGGSGAAAAAARAAACGSVGGGGGSGERQRTPPGTPSAQRAGGGGGAMRTCS